jgi:tetratricopeptide (TPR) repeat protein
MRLEILLARAASLPVLFLGLWVYGYPQAPPSIQVFMPNGSLPPRELRFTLTTDNGRVDTFFTDSKGRFLFTRLDGLSANAGYTITIQGDGRSFDTTSVSFKYYGNTVFYVPVFLRPFSSPATSAPGTTAASKPTEAVDLAELDVAVPKQARDAYDNAMRALRSGNAEDSIKKLEEALAIYPGYFRALNDLGVLFMKLNRLKEAAEVLQRAVKIAPRVYYPQLNLAIVRTRQGEYKVAIDSLEALRKENPGLIEIRTPLADALMAVDRLDEAEGHLRDVLTDGRLDRESLGDAQYKLGLLLNRRQRFEEAARELEAAAKILPKSARIHLQLGGALLQLKRLDEAELELLESYRLGGPEMGGAQLFLGELYFTQKRYELAMRAFEQYLTDVRGAPNSDQIRGVIERIRAALASK